MSRVTYEFGKWLWELNQDMGILMSIAGSYSQIISRVR